MGFSLNNNLAYIIYETHVSNNLMRKPISCTLVTMNYDPCITWIITLVSIYIEIYISNNLMQKHISLTSH